MWAYKPHLPAVTDNITNVITPAAMRTYRRLVKQSSCVCALVADMCRHV